MRRALSYAGLLIILLATAGCTRHNPAARRVTVVMRKYAIEPSEIRLKVGEPVLFEVSTADVQHGFTVPALNIREAVQPGKPAVFEFVPKKKGTFRMECGIICGPRHDDMTGAVVVE